MARRIRAVMSMMSMTLPQALWLEHMVMVSDIFWRLFGMIMIKIPHGFNRGGTQDVDVCPSITTSCFELNNLILEVTDADNGASD